MLTNCTKHTATIAMYVGAYIMCRILRMGNRSFVFQMVLVTKPRWPPHPYMGKLIDKNLQNQKANDHDDLGTWYVAFEDVVQNALGSKFRQVKVNLGSSFEQKHQLQSFLLHLKWDFF